ncbi:MAG: TIGR02391 family protein [Dehalococcoidales bacterium]|nr:TIGR02391 family protein [Dehalococcoidales bacterium]
MDKKRALKLLKQKSKEAVYIASLPYNNNEYVPWRRNIEDILESAFGFSSTEYKRVADVHVTMKGTRAVVQRAYVKLIHRIQLEANSIIQKHEILVIETEPEKKQDVKDTTISPIKLFDIMQFHPKVLEASRPCFVTENYREAILNAFIALITYIKEITALDLDGDDLMNQVFSFNYDKEKKVITKYPIIRINELSNQTERDEQQGLMFLCKGAAAGIRNPKAHTLIAQTNPLQTLEYLSLASLLIRRVEESKVVKAKPPRKRWNLEKFLADAETKCMPEKVEIMKKLIDFTKANSDAGILWGSGAKYGSFAFQKLINNKATSIFQIYTDGTLFLYFQPLKNKGITEAVLYRFRLNVNKIPGVNIAESVIADKNKCGSLSLNILSNPLNLDIFLKAILSLCSDIEFVKEHPIATKTI